ncbi:MAG TPA: hypothetical protein DCQ64_14130 [Candidatus Rokubacteria bacterium]|nr:hypothetical protein [Candidatus Rokubacteria bacterium]
MPPLSPDTIQTLVTGGTGALILGLLIAVWALASGKVRPGSDSEAWRKIAEQSTQTLSNMVPEQEAQARALEALTDSVQKLTSMAELRHQEADLRHNIEGRLKRS